MEDEGKQFRLVYLRNREQINEGESGVRGRVQIRSKKHGLSQTHEASCSLVTSWPGFCKLKQSSKAFIRGQFAFWRHQVGSCVKDGVLNEMRLEAWKPPVTDCSSPGEKRLRPKISDAVKIEKGIAF